MHEGVIVKSLFDIAEKSRREACLQEIETVKVVIGKFHQIVEEVLRMYFDLMKKDLPGFEKAVLEIEERELKIKCKKCQEVILLKEADFSCPSCRSIDIEVIQGNELYIESLKGKQKNKLM